MKPYALALSVIVAGGAAGGGCANAGGAVGGDAHQPADGPARIDGPPGADAPPDSPSSIHDAPGPTPAHVLLSEVMLGPSAGEFIEIVNPTSAAVDLSTYYLADRNDYWKLPGGALAAQQADFIVKFPAGATIAARGVVTVSVGSAAGFTATTAIAPTYSIADGTMAKASAISLIGSQASLTDAGEIIVLFQWDGTAPLVKDVDLFVAGAPSAVNGPSSKSQMAQGAGTYLVDVNTLPTQTAPAPGTSTKRIGLEPTGSEHQNGNGNGITGDDETSENTALSWDGSGYTGPTPGTVPAALTP